MMLVFSEWAAESRIRNFGNAFRHLKVERALNAMSETHLACTSQLGVPVESWLHFSRTFLCVHALGETAVMTQVVGSLATHGGDRMKF